MEAVKRSIDSTKEFDYFIPIQKSVYDKWSLVKGNDPPAPSKNIFTKKPFIKTKFNKNNEHTPVPITKILKKPEATIQPQEPTQEIEEEPNQEPKEEIKEKQESNQEMDGKPAQEAKEETETMFIKKKDIQFMKSKLAPLEFLVEILDLHEDTTYVQEYIKRYLDNKEIQKKMTLKGTAAIMQGVVENKWNINLCKFFSYMLDISFYYRKAVINMSDYKGESYKV